MESGLNNAPGNCEGPHCHLGKLIRKEAEHHLSIARSLEHDDPDLGTEVGTDEAARQLNTEKGIWKMLFSGWARPLKTWKGMRFWNPATNKFVRWSPALYMLYVDLMDQTKPIGEAYTGGPKTIPDAGGGYIGKRYG
jgi:hypothetical protein